MMNKISRWQDGLTTLAGKVRTLERFAVSYSYLCSRVYSGFGQLMGSKLISQFASPFETTERSKHTFSIWEQQRMLLMVINSLSCDVSWSPVAVGSVAQYCNWLKPRRFQLIESFARREGCTADMDYPSWDRRPHRRTFADLASASRSSVAHSDSDSSSGAYKYTYH